MSQMKNRITLDESLSGKVIWQIIEKGLPLQLAISQAFFQRFRKNSRRRKLKVWKDSSYSWLRIQWHGGIFSINLTFSKNVGKENASNLQHERYFVLNKALKWSKAPFFSWKTANPGSVHPGGILGSPLDSKIPDMGLLGQCSPNEDLHPSKM